MRTTSKVSPPHGSALPNATRWWTTALPTRINCPPPPCRATSRSIAASRTNSSRWAGRSAKRARRTPMRPGPLQTHSTFALQKKRVPIHPPPARALGRGGHAEDRLQRALPDELRHGGGGLLAGGGLPLRGGAAPA